MESLEIRQYEIFEVSFMTGARNVKVNATEMAKIFGKRVGDFLANDSVKAFISEMELTLNGVNSKQQKEITLVETRGTKGTWMHRVLALKFAAWLNVKFEVWIYLTIEDILFGKLPDLVQKKLQAVDEVDQAEQALYNTEEYKAYELAKAKQKTINKAIKNQQENQLLLFTK
jgi:sulfatase maturation enzyme AslB (radical SAM superfamily)